MGRAIVIASGKGGTGKTTVTAALAQALSELSYSVLAIDTDLGLRNLDMALGLYDTSVFDFSDILDEKISPPYAIVAHSSFKRLYFLAAPVSKTEEDIDIFKMRKLIKHLKGEFDFVLIDAPAGIGKGLSIAAAGADEAIIVATPDIASLSDARRCVLTLNSLGIKQKKLVLNRVRPSLIKKAKGFNIDEAMDKTSTQILGVVPEDVTIISSTNSCKPLFELKKNQAQQSFLDIAERLCGQSVRLKKITEKYK